MALLDAFVFPPFSVNEPLIDALLLEPDSYEYYVVAGESSGGSGTIDDPFVVDDREAFDSLMDSFQPFTTIHLGPGEFETAGHIDGWQPKRGQRIVGAGIDVTIIKLAISNPSAGILHFALGADDAALVDEFEASDLTIDCDLANQTPDVAAGGVKVFGTHIRLRRLRVINFGTRTMDEAGAAIVTAGAFPDNPEPFDCVVEDCIIQQPFSNSVRETVCIMFAGGESSSDGVMAYHRGCVVRNCFIDCNYIHNEAPIITIEVDSENKTAEATTKVAHDLTAWAVITGALENSEPSTHFNGSFEITETDTTTFKFSYYEPHTPADAVEPTGDMYVGRIPSHCVAIDTITAVPSTSNWEITTVTPHNRLAGQTVVLNNVYAGSSLSADFNAAFEIMDVTNPFKLKFTLVTQETPDASNGWIGVDFYGVVANGGSGTIIENNRILHTTFGFYHAQWSSKNVVIRDNYFHERPQCCVGQTRPGERRGCESATNPRRQRPGPWRHW